MTRLARLPQPATPAKRAVLPAAWRASVHAHLGYATFAEHVEHLFGHTARSTQEKLRVADR